MVHVWYETGQDLKKFQTGKDIHKHPNVNSTRCMCGSGQAKTFVFYMCGSGQAKT